MRRRLVAIATTIATAGVALTAAPDATAANGFHNLMVYKPDYVNSVYISSAGTPGVGGLRR